MVNILTVVGSSQESRHFSDERFNNAEMQKVYEHNPDGRKDRTHYILTVTVDYRGDNPWKQKVNVEIRNEQNHKKLYRVCRNYCTSELQKIIAL